MNRIVTLLTDFGHKDTYVAEIKTVLLNAKKFFTLIDISHEVESFSVFDGAFKLFCTYRFFPKGTIHLVVVDPGVGTNRKCIYVRTKSFHFVGPDNGILSWAVLDSDEKAQIFEIPIDKNVSSTFHGRDVFAPFVVRLINNEELTLRKIESFKIIDFPKTRITKKEVYTTVLSIDKFGNIVTSIPNTENISKLKIREKVLTLSPNYESIRDLALIKGSHGYLEISKKNGSAAKKLRVSIGQKLTLLK